MRDRRTFSGLSVEPLPNGRDWRLLAPLTFGDFTVPAGFVTDLASTPRFLWWWLPPWSTYGPAAIIHDAAYRRQERTRAEADALFLAGMAVLKVPAARRWVIYLSLRLFGGIAWRENSRKKAARAPK